MCWHVIGTFHGVHDAVQVLRSDLIEKGFEVQKNVGIRGFVNRESGRGMLDKEVEDTVFREVADLL